MNLFKRRYFVVISLILLGFSLLSFSSGAYEIFASVLILAAVFVAILAEKRKDPKNFRVLLLLALAVAVLALANAGREKLIMEHIAQKHSGEHVIEGYVKELPSKRDYASEHIVHIESVDGERASFDCVLVTEYGSELSRGDFFRVSALLSPLPDYEDIEYLRSRDPYEHPMLASVDTNAKITYLEPEFRAVLILSKLNSRLSGYLKHHIGGHAGELASALLLGNRELLRDEVMRDFRLAGVYHMLALSGQHVAILVGLLELILSRLRVDKRLRVVLLGALTLFYIALTGFLLSACRAMLMLWVVYLSFLFGRRSDSLTSLFAAVTLIVLITPSAVTDVGLVLSFLSTLGVICAMMIKERMFFFRGDPSGSELRKRFVKLGRELLTLLLISVCALIATLPVVMVNFGELSLATLFSNLFMGTLCEVFMVLSIVTLLLTGSGVLCAFFGDIARYVGEIMVDIISGIADVDGIVISLRYPFAPMLVIGLFITMAVLLSVNLKRRWLMAVVPLCFALVFCLNVFAYELHRSDLVRAEYVGGDCLVISSSDGAYICDASNGRYGAIYEGIELAKSSCHTRIDGIVLTHYHSYHIGSVERAANTQKIERVLLPYPKSEREYLVMSGIYRALEGSGVDVIIYEAEAPISLLGGELTVSDRAYLNGYAHPSVALSYAYGDDRITLVERPYFGTYLEEKGSFAPFITDSDVLIFGADGRSPSASFEIFSSLSPDTDICFSDFELMALSDFEGYLDTHRIFFDVGYKKYDLK